MQRKHNTVKGKKVSGSTYHIAIVIAEFNSDITQGMLKGALEVLAESGVKENNIDIVWVPGGFEIPLMCQKLARARKKVDAILALGCVIRGDTDHYVYIANEATRGVMDVMLTYNIPIANAILTVNNLKQAKLRAGKDNKGKEAAHAALQMLAK